MPLLRLHMYLDYSIQEYFIVEYSPNRKIENISCTWKEKTSHNKFRIGIKPNNLKVTRNLRENTSWLFDRGGYFHETFVFNFSIRTIIQ